MELNLPTLTVPSVSNGVKFMAVSITWTFPENDNTTKAYIYGMGL